MTRPGNLPRPARCPCAAAQMWSRDRDNEGPARLLWMFLSEDVLADLHDPDDLQSLVDSLVSRPDARTVHACVNSGPLSTPAGLVHSGRRIWAAPSAGRRRLDPHSSELPDSQFSEQITRSVFRGGDGRRAVGRRTGAVYRSERRGCLREPREASEIVPLQSRTGIARSQRNCSAGFMVRRRPGISRGCRRGARQAVQQSVKYIFDDYRLAVSARNVRRRQRF